MQLGDGVLASRRELAERSFLAALHACVVDVDLDLVFRVNVGTAAAHRVDRRLAVALQLLRVRGDHARCHDDRARGTAGEQHRDDDPAHATMVLR